MNKDCQTDSALKAGRQYADITIPVELKPEAVIERLETICCGEPAVSCCQYPESNTCEVTVTQTISTRISLRYNVCAGIDSVEMTSRTEHGSGPVPG